MKKKLTKKEGLLLSNWFDQNKRTLPWRDTGDPYKVWISEIMLQQTRIEAVIPHYLRFIEELPDIQSLACCEDDHLMHLWEGLGYYSRARNLKKCAQMLVQQYNGELPADYEKLLTLPGIGPYTAGAISSIAFNLDVPAVDGNVLRILSRYFCMEENIRNPKVNSEMSALIKHMLRECPDVRSSSFNQGLMELGQLICIPNGTPHCEQCPLKDGCLARSQNRTADLPNRAPLKKRRIEKRTLLVIRDGDRFLLQKRPDTGLLAGLYEFIGTNGFLNGKEAISAAEKLGVTPLTLHRLPDAKHIFSHIEWHMHAYEVRCEQMSEPPFPSAILKEKKELQMLAIPSAFRVYTEYYSLRD